MAIIKQGGTDKAAFNAVDETVESIATTVVFSSFNPSSYRNIAKEQEQTDYNFIYLCGGDLRPPNCEVFSAHRVFRHAGIDVSSRKLLGYHVDREKAPIAGLLGTTICQDLSPISLGLGEIS